MKSFTDTSYRNSPRKAFLFLLLLVLWGGLFFLSFIILKGNSEQQYKSIYYSIDATKSVIATVKVLFRYADDWNWITLSVVLSFLVIIFNLNDIFLKPRFQRWMGDHGKDNFYYSGSWWLLRIISNTSITIFEIMLVAYIINISVGTQRIYSLNELKGKYDLILLGTSKLLANGKDFNLYYSQRIDAVIDLYKNGKVNSILISGDHKGKEYSEPLDMQADLIRKGVPKNLISLDMSGYRTFDSIKKLKLKSGKALLFVSQQFHLERALFIARNSGIDAVGYAAMGSMTVQMVKREAFAKTKVILDIYIFNTQAFGMPAFPRRNITIFKGSDIILLSFVLCIVGLAGRLSRNLLIF